MVASSAHSGSSMSRSMSNTHAGRPPKKARSSSARGSPRAHGAGFVASAIAVLFLLSGLAGAAPTHPAAAPHGQALVPTDLLAAAHRAAARGEGPGAVPAPPLGPHPATDPNSTYSLQMAYDPFDGYVVAVTPAYSGDIYNVTYGVSEITWIYSSGSWSVLNTTGAPPELLYPALVADPVDQYVVLFGGLLVSGSTGYVSTEVSSDQTWSFVGGAWTNRTSASGVRPPADAIPELAYDGGPVRSTPR